MITKWSFIVGLHRFGFYSRDEAIVRIANVIANMFNLDKEEANYEANFILSKGQY